MTQEIGIVTKIQDYLLFLEGLPTAKIHEVILGPAGQRALINTLRPDSVEALLLDKGDIKPGDRFVLSGEQIRIPIPVHLLGRAVTPLGDPIDGKAPMPTETIPAHLDIVAPGIDERALVDRQLYTGITIIDTLIPIGHGQRELIFGSPRSAKSSCLLDIISYQRDRNVICVYAAIGKEEIDVRRFYTALTSMHADTFTIVVAAPSTTMTPLINITPHISFSIAEYFRDQGKDVLVILDDLSAHARYLREISLLAGRIPGRESYPADIFYQHSRLVERAGNFNDRRGGGSITLLPVIETDLENFTAFIPTNVMSMTDGHILFNASLRARGYYPAIMPDRSVTRVGHQTQTLLHKMMADKLRSLLAHYQELERYSRFGSELTPATLQTIKQGLIATELLRQEQNDPIDPDIQILLLSLIFTGFFENYTVDMLKAKKHAIVQLLATNPAFTKLRENTQGVLLDGLLKEIQGKVGILTQSLAGQTTPGNVQDGKTTASAQQSPKTSPGFIGPKLPENEKPTPKPQENPAAGTESSKLSDKKPDTPIKK